MVNIFGIDPSCAIGLVLGVIGLLFILWFLSDGRNADISTTTAPTPDEPLDSATPERATMLELPALNAWSAIHTGQHIYAPVSPADRMTPAETASFVELLEAADHDDSPRRLPKHHCPLCVIETCDVWGIPLDEAHVIGKPKYCRAHKHSILAHAKQGA